MPPARISTFDDWVDLSRVWRNDIGVNYAEIEEYQFEAGQPKLYVPDLKFNRHIGKFANQPCRGTRELLSAEKFAEYMKAMPPQAEDVKLVNESQATEPKWVGQKGSME
ncbi:MAG TPA: hypothetical protein VMJ13_03495 [Candidatus Acidoferrum sp.]|nr:hypothetical protein [Candidatus Acidoferrum sp.]